MRDRARRVSAFPEQSVVGCKSAPDLARILLDWAAISARDREIFELDALAVEHPENVMVRRDEERGRVGEGLVVGVPLRIGVTMRADDRQLLDRRIEFATEVPLRRIGGK